MSVLIVTYDLVKAKSSGQYEDILSVIKKDQNWARLSESCYAIRTTRSPSDVYFELKKYIDDNDSVLIFTADNPYYGQHSKEVIEWLGGAL